MCVPFNYYSETHLILICERLKCVGVFAKYLPLYTPGNVWREAFLDAAQHLRAKSASNQYYSLWHCETHKF